MGDAAPAAPCELLVEVVRAVGLWDDKGSSSSERAFAAVRVEAPAACWIPQIQAAAGGDTLQLSNQTAAAGSDPTPEIGLESEAVPSLEERAGEWIFPLSYTTSLAAERGPAACQSLLDRPLCLHVIYTPNAGAKRTVGRVALNLSAFVTSGQGTQIRGTFPVLADEGAASDVANEPPASGGKGEKGGRRPSSSGKGAKQGANAEKPKGGKADGAKAGSKGGEKSGKDVPPPEPEAAAFPGLLPGASVEVVVTLRAPLMTPEEWETSTVVELDWAPIAPLPGKLVELFKADPAKDPFTYSLAFDPLPQPAGQSAALQHADGPHRSEPGVPEVERGPEGGDVGASPRAPTSTIGPPREPFALLSGATMAVDAATNEPTLLFPKPSRRYLTASQAEGLKAAIKGGTKWTAEIARYLKEDRTDLVDPLFERYHSCFEIDLSSLLTPGETVAATHSPFKSLPQDRPATAAAGKEGKKEEKASKGAKLATAAKPQTPVPKDDTTPPVDPVPGQTGPVREALLKPQERQENKKAKPVEDGKDLPENGASAWESSASVLPLQIRLARPLEAKWEPPPPPEIDLRTLIPERPVVEARKDAVQVALEAFQAFVQQTLAELADEFRRIAEQEDFGHLDKKAKRDRLVASLAGSGKWFAVKEKMKAAVAKIAEERSKETRGGSLPLEPDGLYSGLYVTLLDEIHSLLQDGDKQAAAPRGEGVATRVEAQALLRQWAAEYEAGGDADAVEKLHQDLVSEPVGGAAGDWFQYGAFCLRSGQPGKAEECLREALSRDRGHVPSHFALAGVLWARGQPLQAEALLQAVTGNSQVPIADAVVAWTLLALLYGTLPKRAKEVRNCLLEANRLEDARAQRASEDASGQGLPVHLQAARVLLDCHLPELAATALAAQETPGSSGEALFERQLCAARVKRLQGDLEGAAVLLESVVRDKDEEGRASVDLGHVRYAAGQPEAAVEAYTTARDRAGQRPLDLTAYLNLGSLRLSLYHYEEARDVFLEACRHHPCASTWLGAGCALYQLGDLPRAEQALAAANSLNPRDPRVWATLALVCLHEGGREEEAAFALREALRNELKDGWLLAEVGEKCLHRDLVRNAEQALRRAIQVGAGGQTRQLLVRALLRQNDVQGAQQELAAILQLPSSTEEDRRFAEEQLRQL